MYLLTYDLFTGQNTKQEIAVKKTSVRDQCENDVNAVQSDRYHLQSG